MYKLTKVFTLLTILNYIIVSPVQAGFINGGVFDNTPFDPDTWDAVDPTNKNSAVREAGRELDKAIREGIESATKICQEVGPQNCLNPNFQNTYLGLKLAANTRTITGTDSCGGLVYTASEGGAKAVELYALYNGVPIHPELLQLGKQQYQDWGFVSCKIIYGSYPQAQNLVRTPIDNVNVVVPQTDIPKVREYNNEIHNARQSVEPPGQTNLKVEPQDSQSSSQDNSNSVNPTQHNNEPVNEKKQERFRVVW